MTALEAMRRALPGDRKFKGALRGCPRAGCGGGLWEDGDTGDLVCLSCSRAALLTENPGYWWPGPSDTWRYTFGKWATASFHGWPAAAVVKPVEKPLPVEEPVEKPLPVPRWMQHGERDGWEAKAFGVVREDTWGAITMQAWRELWQAVTSGNQEECERLVNQGLVLKVPAGTRLVVGGKLAVSHEYPDAVRAGGQYVLTTIIDRESQK